MSMAYMSAMSPSDVSSNPSDIISEVSEPYDNCSFQNTRLFRIVRGTRDVGIPDIVVVVESYYC